MNNHAPIVTAIVTGLLVGSAWAETVTVVSDRDATLIQLLVAGGAETATGSGDSIYAGRINVTGGATLRRAALRFDLSSIPAGSTVTSVTLTLTGLQGFGDPQPAVLYRATADWGEGPTASVGGGGLPAQPGDATWTKRFFPDVPWTTEGGDFSPAVSAVTLAPAVGPCVFSSTEGLVADVQAWVDDPAANFGWIMLGNEGTPQSVRRFASREAEDPKTHPMLVVEFTPSAAVVGDLNGDGFVNGADLAILLGAWGLCNDCVADINDDGAVDGSDLAILLGAWT